MQDEDRKVILQQPIDHAQVEKLLTQKKTDLLRGFVSQRTRRKFSAYLVMGPDGKTTFEFEPRPEGGKGKGRFGKKSVAKDESGEGATGEANGHAEKAEKRRKLIQNRSCRKT